MPPSANTMGTDSSHALKRKMQKTKQNKKKPEEKYNISPYCSGWQSNLTKSSQITTTDLAIISKVVSQSGACSC